MGLIKGIIFDLDGVLIDSFIAWQKLLNYALKSYGKKPITIEEFKKYWGQGMEKDIEILLPGVSLKDLQEFYEKNFKKFSKYIKIFPETGPLLEKIKSMGIKIAIASNSAPKILEYCIKRAKIDKIVDFYIGASDSIKGKPAPDILIKILEKFNFKPSEVLFVGDSPFDIEAARRASIKVVGIKIKGDFEISNLNDLLNFLN